MPAGDNGRSLADVISIMASTCAAPGDRETLKYRLLGSPGEIGDWGHEYVRNLAGEISSEHHERQAEGKPVDDLLGLAGQIVPYHMTHNAEPEAVDLLIEVDRLELLSQYVDAGNCRRTCLYLTSCSSYLPEPDDMAVLRTAHAIYLKMGLHHDALRVALWINEKELIDSTFAACKDPLEKKQLGYLLARQGVVMDLENGITIVSEEELPAMQDIVSNARLSEHFLELARDLDVMEPKVPEDVYKMHLVDGRAPSGRAMDSAYQNLASTFVNAFVNAGFGQDKLITAPADGDGNQVQWIFKNKDHGKTSAAASLGMIMMWDVEGGLTHLDRYLYTTDHHVKAGALLAIGMVNCGVHNEHDPAYALIFEDVNHDEPTVQIGAIMGLGLAYAGTCKEEIEELLVPLVMDPNISIELAGFAAVSLGLVFTSTCHQECIEAILQALMTRPAQQLSTPFAKMLCLGLGFLFLRKQEVVEATLEIAKTLNEVISKYCQVVLDTMAYAGTGNVLKVQELLALCGEHIETTSNSGWKVAHQGPAVLGVALLAMAEDLGGRMAHRALEHLLQYAEPSVRSAVPLAIAMLNVSNPDIYPTDILSRLSHDSDGEVAKCAIVALGIIGAGTNNARLAGILRNLSSYYYKDQKMLFLVRVAQGLVYMGKGLISVSPYHTDRQLLSGVSLAGLLCVLYACFDIKETLTGKHHYILYYLVTAMKPRYLMTLDEAGKMLPVPARVGTAVDVVAQAGRPKTITGFQTHTTPVLLAVGERAELATEKYIPLSPILEGLVILKRNPEYVESNE
ncbi:unnamed protein product [Ostreobium quekettii]|uniref:26S proteasome non-ATPase regulatory subunit 2 homolog n=1 Tax=Ostreobium quekettii TaxID=121088 RepID=A0A8S1IPI8_9CHLO|nr:unnamed protein product [Ostreobium quekettii]|eukprot:evm.model.scf_1253.1 EVM.evm.TU.scf_1253.1   scf_1253:78-6781(+)